MKAKVKKVFKPTSVNILGKEYKIEYMDNPSEVDIFKRKSLWGQIDFWSNTIRIYDNGQFDANILQVILHEILHGIAATLKISLQDDDKEEEIDLLATALADLLIRNGWLKQ